MAEVRTLLPAQPVDLTLDQLIGVVASQNHERVAVRVGDRTVTYGALQAQSAGISQRLCSQGVRPGDVVGLLVSRSTDLPAAMLGVLGSGAAYLPLDAIHPVERMRAMLDDAGVTVVVSDPAYAPRAAALERTIVQTVAHDAAPGEWNSRSEPERLAYVIYTSGSTGVPKGVEIPHSALSAFVDGILRRPGLSPEDRILAVTTVCFDIAALELLVPLAVGAEVVIAAEEDVRDAARLAALIRRLGITVLQGTPTLWALVLTSGEPLPASLRKFCGGERLPRTTADRLLDAGGELWNLYGPTEATIWCTAALVEPGSGAVPIGQPLDGVGVAVVGEDFREVARGEQGELWISGPLLARGYRNREHLTAERFVVSAAPTGREERFYRTGDLAAWGADGQLQYLGRSDDQVKVNGFRIELGEIEHTLEHCPGIERAIVCAEEHGEETRLVAYLRTAATGTAPTARALREALGRTLPPYMVPSQYRRLRSIPLTVSGKVDRRRLRAEAAEALEEGGQRSASPGSDIERRLHAMWSELFGTSDFGTTDDYFALGGRSLGAARMFARIERELAVKLPIATLLEAPTVATLARVIERGSHGRSWSPLVQLRAGSRTPLFLIHPIGGNVITYRPLVQHLDGDRPVYGLQAVGLDGQTAPLRTVEEMAERYVAEMTRIRPDGPLMLAGASFGGIVAFEAARLLTGRRRAVALLVLLDTDFPDALLTLHRLYTSSPVFRRHAYPWIQRVRSHAAVLRRAGSITGYLSVVLKQASPLAAIDDTRDQQAPVPQGLAGAIRANQRAERVYIPGPYEGDILLLRARDRDTTQDRRDRWRAVARSVENVIVPGNHYTMRMEPHAAAAAAVINARMHAVEAAG